MKITISLLFVLVFSGASAAAPVSSERVDRAFYSMGTELGVSLEGPHLSRKQALQLSEELFNKVDQVEKRLSTWKKESELSRVNGAKVGTPVSISSQLSGDLKLAFQCAALTESRFNPALGPLISAYSLRKGPLERRAPTESQRLQALNASRLDGFSLREKTLTRNREGAALEEGGFGKGLGLDQALEHPKVKQALAKDVSSIVLNFGGQLLVKSKTPYTVLVADPVSREETVGQLELADGSLATSGSSQNGNHLLDPETGKPATYTGSVSVVSKTGFWSDCLTKALYVLGPEKGLQWMRKNQSALAPLGVEAFYAYYQDEKLVIQSSCGLKSNLKLKNNSEENTEEKKGAELKFDCHS